ncbi:MAG: hypothetical protein WCW84_09430 [Sulfurimonas sp.]|jgi:DNA polymerase-4
MPSALDTYSFLITNLSNKSATKFIHHDLKTFDILEYQDDTKMRNLTDAVTKMREKYGMDIVRGGGEM